MADKFDMQVGKFRPLQIPGRALIAFEPTGENLASYKGDVQASTGLSATPFWA